MLEAATGKRGGAVGGLLVDRTARNKLACLEGSGEISLHPNSHLFPLVLLLLLLAAGYCCEDKALTG